MYKTGSSQWSGHETWFQMSFLLGIFHQQTAGVDDSKDNQETLLSLLLVVGGGSSWRHVLRARENLEHLSLHVPIPFVIPYRQEQWHPKVSKGTTGFFLSKSYQDLHRAWPVKHEDAIQAFRIRSRVFGKLRGSTTQSSKIELDEWEIVFSATCKISQKCWSIWGGFLFLLLEWHHPDCLACLSRKDEVYNPRVENGWKWDKQIFTSNSPGTGFF